MDKYDFSGWATKVNLKCSDGRTIMPDAFKHNDGKIVPLVWNHQYDGPDRVLGKALLKHCADGVRAFCSFNDTPSGKVAKELVRHGDVNALSIMANKLKEHMHQVLHGEIREVSLVLASANPGAFIEEVMQHSADGGDLIPVPDTNIFYTGEELELYHADKDDDEKKGDDEVSQETKKENNEQTIQEVWDSMNEDQQTVTHIMIGEALKKAGVNIDDDDEDDDDVKHSDLEGGDVVMKHNLFDQESTQQTRTLSHADEQAIIALAKQSNVGSFKQAMEIFAEENSLAHSEDGVGIFEDYGVLFPEFELLKKGEPETIEKYDQSWVGPALRKIHKSPFSRIRTRHADARLAELKAKGYQKKGDEKTVMGQIKMINRTTDPQTIYIKDSMHRDDIIDVTDFSIVEYQWKMMRRILDETMILAAMVGDGREIDDPDKIHEEHVRPIWKDNDEYTIHYDVDIEAARQELQGTNTGANFSENYIYVESIIRAALYSREKFKGTGTPDFYCTPHLVNVMLLARDLNGRRIYDSKADLARALNVNSIIEVEQFEGLVRTTDKGDKKKLLGLFVNLNDYTFGSTKGGEITRFEDFDMDFNLKKFMLETRLSGSLYRLKSAIALEMPVADDEEDPEVAG